MGVLFEHRFEGLACCLAVCRINLGVPLVNPRQKLIEARQEGRESFGVPAFSFAGVVVGDEGSRLLEVVPPGPADDQAGVALGVNVG